MQGPLQTRPSPANTSDGSGLCDSAGQTIDDTRTPTKVGIKIQIYRDAKDFVGENLKTFPRKSFMNYDHV